MINGSNNLDFQNPICIFSMLLLWASTLFMYFPLVSLVTLNEIANKVYKQQNNLDYDKLDQMYLERFG